VTEESRFWWHSLSRLCRKCSTGRRPVPLTLGRVKSRADWDRLAKLQAKMPPLDWPPFEVKGLILFQSVPSPQGSKDKPLQVIPLGGKEM
jgi:hypothetical protein